MDRRGIAIGEHVQVVQEGRGSHFGEKITDGFGVVQIAALDHVVHQQMMQHEVRDRLATRRREARRRHEGE